MHGSDVAAAVTVVRWADTPEPTALFDGLDRVLFESAGARTFESAADRAAFRWRWLGQFLVHEPDLVQVALWPDGEVAGYLVGCLTDPATSARFADLSYFRDFAQLTARFPAQLHVNLDTAARGRGIGARLVARFVEAVAAAGLSGVHVVTGKGARNVGFYSRNGFVERGATIWNGRKLVFLGRDLTVDGA